MAELKPGWRLVKFGDVVKLNKARCADPAAEGIERYVGLEHIDPEDLRIRRWGLVAEGTTFTNLFKPGQVLFGKRRAYQRKVAVADFEGVCSGDIYVFESKDAGVLLPDLLPFTCQTDDFFDHAVGTSAGSLSPRTNWTQLSQYEFALPPLDEQRRIADVLTRITDTIDATATLVATLEQMSKAYILDAFRNLIASGSAKIVKVSEAGDVLMGRQRSPRYDKGIAPRPYLRVANVYDGYIDTSDVKQMDFDEVEFERYRLVSGDVLLNEGQSRELVGRSAIFRDEVSDCCFQNTLIRFRPYRVSSEYAQAYFRYCLYTGRFAGIAKQTTSIAHLGVGRFAEMPFPMVPDQAQTEITNTIDTFSGSLKCTNKRLAGLRELQQQLLPNWTSVEHIGAHALIQTVG